MAPKRILLVDDDKNISMLYQYHLKTQGFDVLAASDGQAALEMARREKPDLIILDIMLPKLDGIRVCKMLKIDQRYKDIKVLFLSAKGSQNSKDLAQAAGGDEYLVKSVNDEKIMEAVHRLIGPAVADVG